MRSWYGLESHPWCIPNLHLVIQLLKMNEWIHYASHAMYPSVQYVVNVEIQQPLYTVAGQLK